MNRTAEKTFTDLKPAALDDLADDAYTRRRDTDLTRAMRVTPAPPARARRRPTLLLTCAAAATAAGVAGVLIVAGEGGAPGSPPVRATDATSAPADARGLLLASAQTMEQAPIKPGKYWYTRTTTQRRLDERGDRKGLKLGQRTRTVKLPYTYRETRTQESWLSRTGRDRARTITGIGARMSFPTPKDEAAWRRTGAPNLLDKADRQRSVNNYDEPMTHIIGSQNVKTDALLKLPTDAGRLGAELSRRYRDEVREYGAESPGSYAYFVFGVAQDLLGGPISPGTKGALYRLLADLPEVKAGGRMTDRLGRQGVAVSLVETGIQVRLIIDPRSAQLLAYESGARDAQGDPDLSEAYATMGWVDGLESRP